MAGCPFPPCLLVCHLRDPGQPGHEAMAHSVPHPVPLFPVALFLPQVWGAVALKPARGSFQGQVAQDLQLQGLALALSQPYPHPAGQEG